VTGPWLLLGAVALSGSLTPLVLRYAVRRALLDVPTPRSSHTRPTPRGGGLAIAAAIVVTVCLGCLAGLIPGRACTALVGGAVAVALVGWLDDLAHVPAPVRAMVHFGAAVWAVAWLGGMPVLAVGAGAVRLGWPGAALAVVGVVWLVNLYNFMDGIDGLAAAEALIVGATASVLLMLRGDGGLALVAGLVGSASAGFLFWNWAPARIFMGDVGSGMLGFAFGVLAVAGERSGSLPALAWVTLLAVFVVDATVTLVRRVARGERWYLAHRSHAYQRLVQSGWSHAQVVAGASAVNIALAGAAWWGLRTGASGAVCLGTLVAVGVLYAAVERKRPMASASADTR